jgi:hypothetical protein
MGHTKSNTKSTTPRSFWLKKEQQVEGEADPLAQKGFSVSTGAIAKKR